MRHAAMAFIAALAVVSLAYPAKADVTVNFPNPAGYHDFDVETPSVRAAMLNEIRQTFEQLGTDYLKPGQTLKIDVIEIMRAGMPDPRRPLGNLRILTDAMPPPLIKVEYVLRQNGKIVRQATEAISDINYMQNPSADLSSDRLAYEKATLRDWFQARFAAAPTLGH